MHRYAPVNCLNLSKLWVAFGTGKSVRFIADHEIANTLGPDRCEAMPMFHAFTGCDIVSCFGGRGKKPHGTPGPPMKTLLLHSLPWVICQT